MSPPSGASSDVDQALFVRHRGRWHPNPKLLQPHPRAIKTYSTREVLALLNLPSAAPLYAAKKSGLPYLHPAVDLESNRIIASIKRDAWIIFRPC
jgi:hypothetical protein